MADLASFRRAAKRLHTTQPNVSSRIASLEAALGVALMERDAGSVRLTAHGQALLVRARKVLRSLEEFVEAADNTVLFDGVLRLGVTEIIVHTWLRDFMKQFKAQYPNTMVELNVDLSVNLDSQLHEHSIDIAFQSGPYKHKASGEKKLGVYPIVWVASPALGLATNQRLTKEQICHHPIVTHARNTLPFEEVSAHFAAWPELNTRLMPSSNLSACLQMTIDGYGVAALLAPMVKSEIESGELILLDYKWQPSSLIFSARYDAAKASLIVQKSAELAVNVAGEFNSNLDASSA